MSETRVQTESQAGLGEVPLSIQGLSVTYGRAANARRVVDHVDLDVHAGEIVGLVGETGSGKTTIARAILALAPGVGSIRIAGTEVVGLRGRALRDFRRSGAAQYVFQDPLLSLDPDLTAVTSVAEGPLTRGEDRATAIRIAEETLARVGLDPALGSRTPEHLSGGQRQRVAIARALAVSPRMLILDEPVSALDSVHRIEVLELLMALRDAGETGQLFISHDLGSVAGICDRLAVLYQGRIVEQGPALDILRNPKHPYTRLLVNSAPTLRGGASDPDARRELRKALGA